MEKVVFLSKGRIFRDVMLILSVSNYIRLYLLTSTYILGTSLYPYLGISSYIHHEMSS